MSLASEYSDQYAWRQWSRIFELLPNLDGQIVLDLGCAIGDQSAELAARGATVVGIDSNDELLAKARQRGIPRATFQSGNLADLKVDRIADGIWCSFASAYLTNLPSVLGKWRTFLEPNGWILLTEIDDLFGHEPLSAHAKAAFDTYVDDALSSGRYDFRMGRKLRGSLENSGFVVVQELSLDDRELAFAGAAAPAVITAWRARFERLPRLKELSGDQFGQVRDEFLRCLALDSHRSEARVVCCLARNA